SVKTGLELTSDVGIGQSVIYHSKANDPSFYNTAWTLQVIRSVILWLAALIIAWPLAKLYQYPILAFVMPIATPTILVTGFTSISRFLLQKRLQIVRLNAFEGISLFVSSAGFVLLAYLNRTIWALVFGGLFGCAVYAIGSYLILPDVKQRFHLCKLFAL